MIDKPIREFGNVVYVGPDIEARATDKEYMNKIVMDMALREQFVLNHIKDMEFVGDIETYTAGVDILNRFKTVGYKFKIKSYGYDILKNHFECRKEHVPSEITLDFINKMIERYAQQQADKEYED